MKARSGFSTPLNHHCGNAAAQAAQTQHAIVRNWPQNSQPPWPPTSHHMGLLQTLTYYSKTTLLWMKISLSSTNWLIDPLCQKSTPIWRPLWSEQLNTEQPGGACAPPWKGLGRVPHSLQSLSFSLSVWCRCCCYPSVASKSFESSHAGMQKPMKTLHLIHRWPDTDTAVYTGIGKRCRLLMYI